MTDLDKMARELLADSVRRGSETGATLVEAGQYAVVETCDAEHAIRTALLHAPPGYKLVPVEPDQRMVMAGKHFCGNHVSLTIKTYCAMLAAAPEPAPAVIFKVNITGGVYHTPTGTIIGNTN